MNLTQDRLKEIVMNLTTFPMNDGTESQILAEDSHNEIAAVLLAEIEHELKPMNEFQKLVHEMRSAQKKYVLNGGSMNLKNSKSLEWKVDRFLNQFGESDLFKKSDHGLPDQ